MSQLINGSVLLVNGKLQVPDNVDEQDMHDLQFDLFLDLGGHVLCELRSRYRVIVFLRRYVERKHSIRGLGD